MKLSMKLVKPSTSPGVITPTYVKTQCCTLTTQPASIKTKLTDQKQNARNWEKLLNPVENDYFFLPAASRTRHVELGDKWMEYQGITDWEGMLDPLDEKLRSELIRYCKFTQAAYISCDFDHATCQFPRRTFFQDCGMPETGYKVTKILQATAGFQFPKWAAENTPSRLSAHSSYIGYVAVCDDKKEIAALGRRDVVIALRGSATCLEWMENLRAPLRHIEPNKMDDDSDSPMVESGFLSLYTSGVPSLQDMVREEIGRVLQAYGDGPLSLTITGHSLGAALALLAAHDIKTTFKRAPLVTVITFGGPRVGNLCFRRSLEKQGAKVLRIVNPGDLVTKLPGFVIDNAAAADDDDNYNTTSFSGRGGHWDIPVVGLPSWMQRRQWEYAEVGKELRLISKNSSFLDNINVSRCHELKTYMELITSPGSLNCPLEGTQKRFFNDHSPKVNATV